MKRAQLPTTDLYFWNSCREWVSSWRRSGPIKRLGANCFAAGDRLLLLRRDEPKIIDMALHWTGSLLYLVDDDIDGAARSPGLPPSYAARLTAFAARYYDPLLRRADTIVASSDALAATLRLDPRVHADVIRLDPFWAHPLADQRHFVPSPERGLEMVHLGTASHSGALAKIAPAVIAALDRFPDVRFTFIAARGLHSELEAHPSVRRLNVMHWQRYTRWLPRQRFHLALYPLEQTPFDRARSANKIFEHAIVGAVGVYPRDWPLAAMAAGGALLAPGDPAQWTESLMRAIEGRSELPRLAAAAQASAANYHDGARQRRIWAKLLNLETERTSQ